jgi:hypothetical protein
MLARAFGGDLEGLVHWMRKEVRRMEDEHRRRRKAAGQTVLGAAVLKRIHPFAEPRTPRERRGERVPTFMVRGGYGLDEIRCLADVRERCDGEQRRFFGEYRESLKAWRAGDRDVVFPAGTYQMRVLHGAKVAEPASDAILCAPGDLSLAPRDGAPREDPKALLEALRDEVLSESAEQAAADALRSAAEPPRPDADAEDADGGAEPAAKPPARPPTATTELESPARSAERPHPRRLVPLRTRHRRRGKRRKPT